MPSTNISARCSRTGSQDNSALYAEAKYRKEPDKNTDERFKHAQKAVGEILARPVTFCRSLSVYKEYYNYTVLAVIELILTVIFIYLAIAHTDLLWG